jgi:hypothetical protein
MSTEPLYVIMKRGLFYRPRNQGYTGIRKEAGLYTLDEVAELFPNIDCENQDGISYMDVDHAPEFAPGCWHDLKLKVLENERDTLREELDEIKRVAKARSQVREKGDDSVAYFVSYVHENGFGNATVYVSGGWTDTTCAAATEHICEKMNLSEIVVLHFTPMTSMAAARPARR